MNTTVVPKQTEVDGETCKRVSRDKLRKQVEALIRDALRDGDHCAAKALQNVIDDFDTHDLVKDD